MKAHLIVAIATLTVSSIATAQQAAPDAQSSKPSNGLVQPRGLTRAEVLADFAMWRRAGLGILSREGGGDTLELRRREAEYFRLRNGPEYVAELRRLEGPQSDRMAGASATSSTN